ncbi:MAG: hypothetical protein JXR78_13345, partial [Victivallales bacterium]|nr:hypothetical protein [Victivallales bacterium]
PVSTAGDDSRYHLEILRSEEYLSDYKVYICPSTTDQAGTGTDELYSGTGTNLSYVYVPYLMEGANVATGNPDSGIIADAGTDDGTPAPNHTKYGNILYLDGHVSAAVGDKWYAESNTGYVEDAGNVLNPGNYGPVKIAN